MRPTSDFEDAHDTSYVPLRVGEHTIYLEVTRLDQEEEVAFRAISIEDFAKSVGAVAESVTDALVRGLKRVRPDKVVVEFGCELGMETGKLTAMLVRGSAKANLKVSMEWTQHDLDS